MKIKDPVQPNKQIKKHPFLKQAFPTLQVTQASLTS